jgi:predicted GH43/DUF377 family glycosyl hydrolase
VQTFPIIRNGVVLEATALPFEDQAVLNPGCIEEDGIIHMVYRAVQDGNYSSIGYAQLKGSRVILRREEPLLKPELAYEVHGLEDPRLIKCDGVYYLFYTVYDGRDAQVAYATATRLPYFTKQGIISPKVSYGALAEQCAITQGNEPFAYLCQHYWPEYKGEVLLWEKDTFIFPKKIGGKFALIHRIKPEIQLLYFDDFSQLTAAYWLEYLASLETGTLLTQKYWFEDAAIGGGCPPLETEVGWLFIYHCVQWEGDRQVYRSGAALLDRDDPKKVLGRLPYPLFGPETEWEKNGDVSNVVFPTGAVIRGDSLDIYYGAADKRIAWARISLSALLAELKHHPQ